MRHKIKIVFSVIVMTLLCTFGLLACGGNRGRGNDDSDANNHSAQYFTVDENSHWKICEDCGKTFGKGTHNFDADGYCTVCDYTENYTEGLQFFESNGIYAVTGIEDRTVTDIIVPAYYQGKPVTVIGPYAFASCVNLTSITMPNSIMIIWSEAFRGCSSLTSIEIPNGVVIIKDGAFIGCSSLTSIVMPSNAMIIGDGVFFGCSSLTSIAIPNGTASIGGSAFTDCVSLVSIEIPSSIKSIGMYAFSGCSSLTQINFNGTKAQWLEIDKMFHWNVNTPDYTVTCTDGTLDKEVSETA